MEAALTATRCDVVVVGAGAIGSATAWWLARRGVDTVLLEQFEQGHVRGSSHGQTRIFRLAYDDRRYVRMAAQALPLWRELEDDADRTLLVTTGGVDHGDATRVAAIASVLDAESAAYTVMSPTEAGERWPTMRFEGDVVVQPDAGRCMADATVRTLQERAAAHGAEVRFGTGAASVSAAGPLGDGARVTAGDDAWVARVAVVTAGSWVSAVAGTEVGLPPMRITREQIQHFAPRVPLVGQAEVRRAEEWPSFIHHRERTVYGLLSPAEGVKVAFHHDGPVVDPDARTFEPDERVAADAAAYAKSWLPGVDPTPVLGATCLYTSTPTHDFVLERHGPLVVGSPCSGHGFKFAPLIGRILADLATDSSFSTQ